MMTFFDLLDLKINRFDISQICFAIGVKCIQRSKPIAASVVFFSVINTTCLLILPPAQAQESEVHAGSNNGIQTSQRIAQLHPVYSDEAVATFDGTRTISLDDAGNTRLPLRATQPWSINLFVYTDKMPDELTILGGFGDAKGKSGTQRYLIKFNDGINFWGNNIDVASHIPLDLGKWQMLTATYDGNVICIYKNGVQIATNKVLSPDSAEKSVLTNFLDAAPMVGTGIASPWGTRGHLFQGKIAGFTIWGQALTPEFLHSLLVDSPLLEPVYTYVSSPDKTDAVTVFDGTSGVKDTKVSNLPTQPDHEWTINLFIYSDHEPENLTIFGGFGDTKDNSGSQRYLMFKDKVIEFWGSNIDLLSDVQLDLNEWQMITATYDGQVIRLYKNGAEIKSSNKTQAGAPLIQYDQAHFVDAAPEVALGVRGDWHGREHLFKGRIKGFTIWDQALSSERLKALLTAKP